MKNINLSKGIFINTKKATRILEIHKNKTQLNMKINIEIYDCCS